MGRWLVKVGEDRFLEWSSIVDAPVTPIMTKDELLDWLRDRYGSYGVEQAEERMARAMPLSEIGWNRAGPREESLTPEQIIERYSDQHQGDPK